MNVRHDMVTVLVVRPDASGNSHEFLQLHRVADDYMGGTWQIIRGGVDADESYVEAALREMVHVSWPGNDGLQNRIPSNLPRGLGEVLPAL